MCNNMSLTMEDHVDKESPNLGKSMKRVSFEIGIISTCRVDHLLGQPLAVTLH